MYSRQTLTHLEELQRSCAPSVLEPLPWHTFTQECAVASCIHNDTLTESQVGGDHRESLDDAYYVKHCSIPTNKDGAAADLEFEATYGDRLEDVNISNAHESIHSHPPPDDRFSFEQEHVGNAIVRPLPTLWVVTMPLVESTIERIRKRTGREPTDCEIADAMDLSFASFWRMLVTVNSLGASVCSQRRQDRVLDFPVRALYNPLYEATRLEIRALFQEAVRDVAIDKPLLIRFWYEETAEHVSVTSHISLGESTQGDAALSLSVNSKYRDGASSDSEMGKRFTVQARGSREGTLHRGALWDDFREHARLERTTIAWYSVFKGGDYLRWLRRSISILDMKAK